LYYNGIRSFFVKSLLAPIIRPKKFGGGVVQTKIFLGQEFEEYSGSAPVCTSTQAIGVLEKSLI